MMVDKYFFIGDLHGSYEILLYADELMTANETYKFIFVGDYVDSFINTADSQTQTLKLIKQLKDKFKDRIIFLIGNHDLNYISDSFRCSGYVGRMRKEWEKIIKSYIEDAVLDIYFSDVEHSILATHAGLSKQIINREFHNDLNINLAVEILDISFKNWRVHLQFDGSPLHSFRSNRMMGGQGIFWTRPSWCYSEGCFIAIEGVHQVFGHTYQEDKRVRVIDKENNFCIDTDLQYLPHDAGNQEFEYLEYDLNTRKFNSKVFDKAWFRNFKIKSLTNNN